MSFASQLRKLRESKGWSQYRLAKEAGLSRPAITAIEDGINESPRFSTVEKLADALGVTVNEFRTISKNPSKSRK